MTEITLITETQKIPISSSRVGYNPFIIPHTYVSGYDNSINIDGTDYKVDKIERFIKTNQTEGGVSGTFTVYIVNIYLKKDE